MGKNFKNYNLDPKAVDIAAMPEKAAAIGLTRITDEDDIDIVDAFNNVSFDASNPCEEIESPPEGAGPWQLVGMKKGASWKQDSLTFDDFDSNEDVLASLYDASRGTIDGYGTFPYKREKCQAFAANQAAKKGGSIGSEWLTEAGDDVYAQFIVGFPGVEEHGGHPWGSYYGNWIDGHVKSTSYYKYDSVHYAGSYVQYVGSKCTTSNEANGIPKLSADVLWIDDGYGNGSVELFQNSSSNPMMIHVDHVNEKVIIDTSVATADGSIHQISINGMTNKDSSDDPNEPGSANVTDLLKGCEAKVIEVKKRCEPDPFKYATPTNLIQIGIRG